MSVRIVVVAGTGTDVGKTHVSAALLGAARAHGLAAAGYKPVATGAGPTEICEDARRHAEALAAEYVPPTYAYARPVSPHLAAREEGRPIDVDVIAARARELGAGKELLVVETAGGLFSPLAPGVTNVDLARALGDATLLLVAADRLGVLHDVGAVLAGTRGLLARPTVVLSAPARDDASTGQNGAELDRLGLGPVLARFPRAAPDAGVSRVAAEAVLDAIGLVRRRPS